MWQLGVLAITAVIPIMMAGCYSGGPSLEDTESLSYLTTNDEPVFPHKATWSTPEEHGLYLRVALLFDTKYCANCHGKALEGESGPGCYSCHTVYPHTGPGVAVSAHGQFVLKNGEASCTTKCHGSDFKGGLSGVGCDKCHASYPARHHTGTWKTPDHGPMAKADFSACTLCHGADLLGGLSKVSCYSCHMQYPHIAAWKTDHAKILDMQSATTGVTRRQYIQQNCMSSCHDIIVTKLGPACSSCHDPQDRYPHPSGWYSGTDPAGGTHGLTVVAASPAGTKQAAQAAGCLTACHGGTGNSGFLADNHLCTTCHVSYPHPGDWSDTGNGYSPHGLAVIATQGTITKDDDSMDTANSKGFGACVQCHEGNMTLTPYSWKDDIILPKWVSLSNGAQVPRCYACHYYPHKTYLFNGKEDNPWSYFHNNAFSDWYYLEYYDAKTFAGTRIEYAQKNCGGTYTNTGDIATSGGCHTDGPHRADGGGPSGCNFCHKAP